MKTLFEMKNLKRSMSDLIILMKIYLMKFKIQRFLKMLMAILMKLMILITVMVYNLNLRILLHTKLLDPTILVNVKLLVKLVKHQENMVIGLL